MDAKAYSAWMKVGFDMWMLSAEASMVIGLRLARIAAGGPTGTSESQLMIAEKIRAAMELQTRMMGGALGSTPLSGAQGTVKLYRGKVAANRKRLSRTRG